MVSISFNMVSSRVLATRRRNLVHFKFQSPPTEALIKTKTRQSFLICKNLILQKNAVTIKLNYKILTKIYAVKTKHAT